MTSNRIPSLETALYCLLAILSGVFIVRLLPLADSPYIAFAFAGSFLTHLLLRPRTREIATAIAFALLYGVLYVFFGGRVSWYPGAWLGTAGAFCGLGSLTVFLMLLTYAPSERPRIKEFLGLAVVFPCLCTLSSAAVAIGVWLMPNTYDFVLYAFDRSLGIDPYAPAHWFHTYPVLFTTSAIVYNSLPLFISVCVTLWYQRTGASRKQLRLAVVLLGVFGFAAYQITPACGPLYRFRAQFPYQLPPVSELTVAAAALPGALRNAMPSLHVGWVLLCLWNTRRLGWPVRVIAAGCLCFTALATIGSGEHYLIDLVVVVPLVLFVQLLAIRDAGQSIRLRAAGLLASGAMTLSWLLALRYGLFADGITPQFLWTLILATLAICLFMKRRYFPPEPFAVSPCATRMVKFTALRAR